MRLINCLRWIALLRKIGLFKLCRARSQVDNIGCCGDGSGAMNDAIMLGFFKEVEDDGKNKSIEEEIGDGYPVLRRERQLHV